MTIVRAGDLVGGQHDAVWSLLSSVKGRDKALTSRQLARLTGMTEREVRQVVQDLRLEGRPIASLVNPPFGYFVPATREEAEECLRHLYSRPKEIFRVAAALEKAFDVSIPRREVIASLFPDFKVEG